MIAVIDYGRGNLFSISNAFRELGFEFVVTDDPSTVAQADQILLPGVGAFGDAISALHQSGMFDALLSAANAGKRVLGICLGMQLLADSSSEFGDNEGLGLIKGDVRLLRPPLPNTQDFTRIPNIGWRKVETCKRHTYLDGLDGEPYFYFVHSYAFYCANEDDISAVIRANGGSVSVIVGRDNVWGFQFHPEKSGSVGLQLLEAFFDSRSDWPNQLVKSKRKNHAKT